MKNKDVVQITKDDGRVICGTLKFDGRGWDHFTINDEFIFFTDLKEFKVIEAYRIKKSTRSSIKFGSSKTPVA